MPKQELLTETLPQNEVDKALADPEIIKMLQGFDARLQHMEQTSKPDEYEELDHFEMPSDSDIAKMDYNQLVDTIEQYERHHHHRMRHGAAIERTQFKSRRFMDRAKSIGAALPSWKETLAMGIGAAIAAPVLNWSAGHNPLPTQIGSNWPFYADLIILVASFAGAAIFRKYKHTRLGFTGSAVYCVGALIDMAMQVGQANQSNAGLLSVAGGF